MESGEKAYVKLKLKQKMAMGMTLSVHHLQSAVAALALLCVLWTASISPVAAGFQGHYVQSRVEDHGQFRQHQALPRFDIQLEVSGRDEQEKLARSGQALP